MARRIVTLLLMATCSLSFAANKPVVTVLDLTIDQVSQSEMRTVVSLLTSALFKTGKLTVIDVAQRDTILKEIEFSAQDCSDEACQLEIGKLLAAEYIVVGRFGKLGKKYILSVKMIETSTSRAVSTADGAYAELDEIMDDMANLASQLAGAGNEAAAQATAASPAATQPSTAPAEETKPAQPAVATKPRATQARIAPVRIAALVSAGGAVACAAVAVPLLLGAINYLNGPVDTAFRAYMAEPDGSTLVSDLYTTYLGQFDSYKGRLIPAVAVGGGAAALLIAAGVLFIVPVPTTAKAQPAAVSVVPTASGIYLSFHVPAARR
jgi:TolB-like protein